MDDFAELQSSITSSLVSTTRAASQLAGEDLPFHRSLDPTLGSTLDRQNARLLALASDLLDSAARSSESVRSPRSLKSVDAIDADWRAVVDVVDSLLERADIAMDEFTGAVKRFSPAVSETPATAANEPRAPRISRLAAQIMAQDMEKPQLFFEHVPTNKEERPFKPLLSSKPHATTPLLTEPVPADGESSSFFPHPYESEIQQFEYPTSVYRQTDPVQFHPFESTTATFVDSEEAVEEMLQELRQATEIAIDLEHHDQRSYIGLVSLMQISTRDRDWIVDTLKPWRRKLQCLNEVFANPNILKVFHGAHMDIVWLQRDLGLYVVGLFDTHYAARALGYPGGSLAYLLKRFVNVDAQKQYQMADWRVRPLPTELFDYARSDTHYLLYIYDCMRNELIQRSDFAQPNHQDDKLWNVLRKSSATALQRYEHPVYDFDLGQGPTGWYRLLSRRPATFTKEQFAIFRAVHQWRDNVAREQDDSLNFVMPNHHIVNVAREMATTRAAVLAVAQPTTQTLRLRVDELVSVILRAKEEAASGPDMQEILGRIEPLEGVMREEPSHSVASCIPSKAFGIVNHESAILPLRSATSSFWGKAFESSTHQQQRPISSKTIEAALAVPLPPLTAEVFRDVVISTPMSEPSTRPHTGSSTPAQPYESEGEKGVFVLKDLGKKRKHSSYAGVDNMAAQSNEVSIDGRDEIHTRDLVDKAEKKRAKQEARRAAAAATGGATSADRQLESPDVRTDEPFDYAAAPSILHPPRESREAAVARRKKEVNPYAKALDTKKGLPRVQKERAGRSMTYK